MGQTIEIKKVTPVGRVLVVDTDRSITGQDGESFTGKQTAGQIDTFGAQLAVRLFDTDSEVDYVHVMSNTVSIRRRTDWDDAAIAAAPDVVAEFFRVYPD